MAYDVSTRPGQWVMQRSARRSRWIAGGLAVFFVVTGLITGLVVGQRLPLIASGFLVAFALLVRRPAERYVDRDLRMRRGAWAEEAVGETLNSLRGKGWIVMHDIKSARGGNLDHLVSGPNGVYLIETKARRYEDDHLRRVMHQALWLHDQLDCFVTPVICLHLRGGKPFRTHGVWVIPHGHLLDSLHAQHNQQVDFERLARFADAV